MKKELRLKAKALRKTLKMKDISEELVELIRKEPCYINAKNVMIYYPTELEVNLLGLLSDDKNFFLPKVDAKNLLVCPYENGCTLEKSHFNIYEPCSTPVDAKILDLIIVPALMVDEKGYRLGYGGGFYDRFLAEFGDIATFCAIPKDLFVEALPHEDFDLPIDFVVKSTK